MKRLVLLAALAAAAGCGLVPELSDGKIPVLVNDHPTALGTPGGALFEVRYCEYAGGDSYLVSELRTELDGQGAGRWDSGFHLRYVLSDDLNRDHRFGPGDAITVSEGDFGGFSASDAGTTYKVTLYREPELGMEEKLAEADWLAQ